ncbi:ribose-phosphate pyrophosphokinase [Candidatus Uhrbacteria bacterium]|nr:ribose-phosphate pyrophosphokinase [Candidatus Uhrbacteria bacterium]
MKTLVYTLPDSTPCEHYIRDHLTSDAASPPALWKVFPNGEQYVRLPAIAKKIVVVGRTWGPGDNLWKTLLLVHAARQNGAEHIVVVLTYYAYSRQDRMRLKGEPLSGALFAHLCAQAGASEIITMDLHSRRVQEASPIPIISVPFIEEFARAYREIEPGYEDSVIVAPDKGAKEHANEFAGFLKTGKKCIWIEKERDPVSGAVHQGIVHGLAHNGRAVLLDDMLDTGGTIEASVNTLRERGFHDISLCVTHPIFSGEAPARIKRLGFSHIIVSDTLPLADSVIRLPDIHVISAGPKLTKAISQSLRT